MVKQKTFYLLLILLFGSGALSSVQAQLLTMNIIEWSGDGTTVEAAVFDKITFTDDDLVVNYTDRNAQGIDMLSIRKITFSGNPTSIAGVDTENQIFVSFDSNQLVFSNLPEGGSRVAIYSVSGVVVQNTVVNSDSLSLDVTHLDKGIYVVKVNNQIVKLARP